MADSLTIHIISFSYKSEFPIDASGHGGGFVFDCRCLPNPGREEQFQDLSGLDKEVKEYLHGYPEVQIFLSHIEELIRQAVGNYLDRDFEHLTVAFGCTGGQHRSVYCAEELAKTIKRAFPVVVEIIHTNITPP